MQHVIFNLSVRTKVARKTAREISSDQAGRPRNCVDMMRTRAEKSQPRTEHPPPLCSVRGMTEIKGSHEFELSRLI